MPEDLEATFSGMVQAKADSLLVNGSSVFYAYRQRIAELALLHELPAITNHRAYADAGALLGYGGDVAAAFRQAGSYVARS